MPCPVSVLDADGLNAWLAGREPRIRAWVDTSGFEAKAGAVCPIPGRNRQGGAHPVRP